jgi:hypothetical protein
MCLETLSQSLSLEDLDEITEIENQALMQVARPVVSSDMSDDQLMSPNSTEQEMKSISSSSQEDRMSITQEKSSSQEDKMSITQEKSSSQEDKMSITQEKSSSSEEKMSTEFKSSSEEDTQKLTQKSSSSEMELSINTSENPLNYEQIFNLEEDDYEFTCWSPITYNITLPSPVDFMEDVESVYTDSQFEGEKSEIENAGVSPMSPINCLQSVILQDDSFTTQKRIKVIHLYLYLMLPSQIIIY